MMREASGTDFMGDLINFICIYMKSEINGAATRYGSDSDYKHLTKS